MKLKVNWGGQRQVVDLGDRGVDDITLGEFKQIVKTQFHSAAQDFELSLNKQDILPGEDQVLSSFGLVSGDLVHVIGDPLPVAASATDTASGHSGSESLSQSVYQTASNGSSGAAGSSQDSLVGGPSSALLITAAPSSQSEENVSMSTEVSGMEDLCEADRAVRGSVPAGQLDQSDVNRYMMEPLVLRESTSTQVPAALSQLYACADCTGATDALWVAVHCLMLESGFSAEAVSDDCMPKDWRRPGYYRCEYSYPLSVGVKGHCSITGVTLGNTVAVHGVATSEQTFNTETLHLSSPQFVRGLGDNIPAVYRALDRLTLVVKDKICLPLANEISTSAGYKEQQGLLSLPREVLLRVTCCLDVQSLGRLGQTCQWLNGACSDYVIWRRLYLQHFPEPRDKSLSRDWCQLYKQAILEKKLREESERLYQRSFWDRNVWEPPRPFAPVPRAPFPFMIGGEHDLHPEFVSGIPDPMGRNLNRHGRNSNPLLPSMDRRTPGDLTNSPFSRRGNMTGSPFSRNSFF